MSLYLTHCYMYVLFIGLVFLFFVISAGKTTLVLHDLILNLFSFLTKLMVFKCCILHVLGQLFMCVCNIAQMQIFNFIQTYLINLTFVKFVHPTLLIMTTKRMTFRFENKAKNTSLGYYLIKLPRAHYCFSAPACTDSLTKNRNIISFKLLTLVTVLIIQYLLTRNLETQTLFISKLIPKIRLLLFMVHVYKQTLNALSYIPGQLKQVLNKAYILQFPPHHVNYIFKCDISRTFLNYHFNNLLYIFKK